MSLSLVSIEFLLQSCDCQRPIGLPRRCGHKKESKLDQFIPACEPKIQINCQILPGGPSFSALSKSSQQQIALKAQSMLAQGEALGMQFRLCVGGLKARPKNFGQGQDRSVQTFATTRDAKSSFVQLTLQLQMGPNDLSDSSLRLPQKKRREEYREVHRPKQNHAIRSQRMS